MKSVGISNLATKHSHSDSSAYTEFNKQTTPFDYAEKSIGDGLQARVKHQQPCTDCVQAARCLYYIYTLSNVEDKASLPFCL